MGIAAFVLLSACGGGDSGSEVLSGAGSGAGPRVAGAAVANAAGIGGSSIPPQVNTPLTAAGTGGVATPAGPGDAPLAAAALPCEVAKVVANKCQSCHASMPVGGAPMPLMKPSDFTAQIKSLKTLPGETHPVSQLVKLRINDVAMPMPPGALLPEQERATLNSWLDQHTPPGAAGDAACAGAQPAAAPPTVSNASVQQPDGSRCYTFRNHGQPVAGDTTAYNVPIGEQYVSFYYNAPWTEPSEIVRWTTVYDNRAVLHHWLLYTTLGNTMDGTFLPSIGTHIGDAAQLVAGWAVGGNDTQLPEDVGLRLPPPGAGLLLEWHFYNSGGAAAPDQSGVQICVLPAGSRKHTAGMTWLGTENFNGPFGMPPKTASSFSGTCFPSRAGMNATDPIHIFTLWPHMHTYGRNMKTVVNRASGALEEVFNKPFDFNYQITYPASIDLLPGESITSTCSFDNTSNNAVAFGPSTTQEMCYQFAFSYPAGALDNGVLSLVGATNTCW